jgi:hypothetical protein
VTRILLLLLLTTPLLADSYDVQTFLTPQPDRVEPGATLSWTATVENLGPATARFVEFISEGFGQTCVDEVVDLAPGERRSRDCSATVPPGAYFGSVVALGRVSPYEHDPNQENNVASEQIDVNTPPDLIAFPETWAAVDPGLPFTLGVRYSNFAHTTATGVTITITGEGITGFRDLPPNCVASGTTTVCSIGTVGYLPGQNGATFTLTPVAADVSNAPITISTTIRANEGDAAPENNVRTRELRTYLTHFVTSTNDAGAGSLRDAIHANNIACTDPEVWCKVAFRIAGVPQRTHVIRPASPLPALTGANTAVDGLTQARYFADSNPDGPEIELVGDALRENANGLTVPACRFRIAGLAIHSFPANGILVNGSGCEFGSFFRTIEANSIGTDATGLLARPNARGIFVDGPSVAIARNLISGNSRSGIFVQNGYGSTIHENTIGLTRTLQPLGNGASGVYLGAGGGSTDVFTNYIGFNAHYGVSLDRKASACNVGGNSFQANGGLGIDSGLDGPTLADPSGPLLPVITNAFFDAAQNVTVVEGTVDRLNATEVQVMVFANDAPDESGYGEGQYFLGLAPADGNGRWRFVSPGRTPGRFLAAVAYRYTIYGFHMPQPNGVGAGAASVTSEFSRTVEVQFPPE